MNDEELQIDPLFAGMTRTPSLFGIPFFAFLITWFFAFLVFIVSGNPFLLLIGFPIHGIIYAISANDHGIFEDAYLWIITCGKCTNFRFWGARSFSPNSVKRYGDEWD